MSNAVIDRLDQERQGLLEYIDTTLTIAANEERDLVDAETRTLGSTKTRLEEIDAQLKQLVEFEQVRAAGTQIDRRITTNPRPQKNAELRAQVNESLGSLFTQSDQFRNWSGGTSGRYEYEAAPSEIRAPLFTTTPPGSLLLPQPQKYNAQAPNYLTPLLSNIQRIQVSTGSVEVVTYTDPSGATVVDEGALKPEITTGVTLSTVNLETIAGVLHASRQFMADVAAASSWISQNLTRAVIKEIERLILVTLQAAPIPTLDYAAGTELLAWIRGAQAQIETNGYSADTLLAHPSALANIDLQILSLGGSAQAVVGQSAWGLNAIPVAAFAPADVYVLDSSAALVWYERAGISTYMSDSDILGEGATAQSGFRRNIITVLAEARGAAHVPVPAAAIKQGIQLP